MPPNTAFAAKVHFSTATRDIVVASYADVMISTASSLGFRLHINAGPGIPTGEILPRIKAEAEAIRYAANFRGLKLRHGVGPPPLTPIALPDKVQGFLIFNGMDLERKGFSRHDLNALRDEAMFVPSFTKAEELLRSISKVVLCTDTELIPLTSRHFVDDGGGTLRESGYDFKIIVSTLTESCVTVDSSLIDDVGMSGMPQIDPDLPIGDIRFIPPREGLLLKTTPNYICTGIHTASGGPVGGTIADTFISFNSGISRDQLQKLCTDTEIHGEMPIDLEEERGAMLKNPDVFSFRQITADD